MEGWSAKNPHHILSHHELASKYLQQGRLTCRCHDHNTNARVFSRILPTQQADTRQKKTAQRGPGRHSSSERAHTSPIGTDQQTATAPA